MRKWCVGVMVGLVASVAGAATITPDEPLTQLVKKTAADAVAEFSEQKLKDDEFAITVIDLRDPAVLKSGSYRGDQGIYPASVVKLFYLVAAHQWMEEGKLQDSEELRRALRDMIVKSTNDATSWVIEAITDAGNGPLLPEPQWKEWQAKRNSINGYFQSLGYTGINTCQTTYIEGPYGRERLFLAGGKNRNSLTTDATARLMMEIALGQAVTPDRSKQMMELLERDTSVKARSSDDQATGFSAMALPKDAKLWSKAGWTSTSRHDVAYVELADGRKMVIAVFTENHANQRPILSGIVGNLLAGWPKP